MKTRNRAGIVYAMLTISLWSLSAYFSAHLQRISPFLLVGISFIAGWADGRSGTSAPGKLPLIVFGIGVARLVRIPGALFPGFSARTRHRGEPDQLPVALVRGAPVPVYLRGYSLRWNHLLGALAGLLGAWVVVTGGALRFNLNSAPGYGYAAIAAVIWASYSLLIKRFQPLPDSLVSGFCLLAGLLALGLFF